MPHRPRYPQELRERAMRLVREHRGEYPSEWATISSIAGKLGMDPETLRLWLRREEVDHHQRPGLTTDERHRDILLGKLYGRAAGVRAKRGIPGRCSTLARIASARSRQRRAVEARVFFRHSQLGAVRTRRGRAS